MTAQVEHNSILTQNDVCELLHISPTTLWRWRREAGVEPVGKGMRARAENNPHYSRADIQRLIDARQQRRLERSKRAAS